MKRLNVLMHGMGFGSVAFEVSFVMYMPFVVVCGGDQSGNAKPVSVVPFLEDCLVRDLWLVWVSGSAWSQ